MLKTGSMALRRLVYGDVAEEAISPVLEDRIRCLMDLYFYMTMWYFPSHTLKK